MRPTKALWASGDGSRFRREARVELPAQGLALVWGHVAELGTG